MRRADAFGYSLNEERRVGAAVSPGVHAGNAAWARRLSDFDDAEAQAGNRRAGIV